MNDSGVLDANKIKAIVVHDHVGGTTAVKQPKLAGMMQGDVLHMGQGTAENNLDTVDNCRRSEAKMSVSIDIDTEGQVNFVPPQVKVLSRSNMDHPGAVTDHKSKEKRNVSLRLFVPRPNSHVRLAINLKLLKMKPTVLVGKLMNSRIWHDPGFSTFLGNIGIIDVSVQWRVTVVVNEKRAVFVDQMV